jgi:hypothetical protein
MGKASFIMAAIAMLTGKWESTRSWPCVYIILLTILLRWIYCIYQEL